MPRPPSIRFVSELPDNETLSTQLLSLMPDRAQNASNNRTDYLNMDELEALRLVDLLQHSQIAAAKMMGISQPTLSRILRKARQKLVSSLLSGRQLIIKQNLPNIWQVKKHEQSIAHIYLEKRGLDESTLNWSSVDCSQLDGNVNAPSLAPFEYKCIYKTDTLTFKKLRICLPLSTKEITPETRLSEQFAEAAAFAILTPCELTCHVYDNVYPMPPSCCRSTMLAELGVNIVITPEISNRGRQVFQELGVAVYKAPSMIFSRVLYGIVNEGLVPLIA